MNPEKEPAAAPLGQGGNVGSTLNLLRERPESLRSFRNLFAQLGTRLPGNVAILGYRQNVAGRPVVLYTLSVEWVGTAHEVSDLVKTIGSIRVSQCPCCDEATRCDRLEPLDGPTGFRAAEEDWG